MKEKQEELENNKYSPLEVLRKYLKSGKELAEFNETTKLKKGGYKLLRAKSVHLDLGSEKSPSSGMDPVYTPQVNNNRTTSLSRRNPSSSFAGNVLKLLNPELNDEIQKEKKNFKKANTLVSPDQLINFSGYYDINQNLNTSNYEDSGKKLSKDNEIIKSEFYSEESDDDESSYHNKSAERVAKGGFSGKFIGFLKATVNNKKMISMELKMGINEIKEENEDPDVSIEKHQKKAIMEEFGEELSDTSQEQYM